MGAFSIHYHSDRDSNTDYPDTYSLDWSWTRKGEWTRSCREYGLGHRWYDLGELDEEAYYVLLEAFGLGGRENEFPLDIVVRMSPAQIAREGGRNPASSSLGDSRYASEVRDV